MPTAPQSLLAVAPLLTTGEASEGRDSSGSASSSAGEAAAAALASQALRKQRPCPCRRARAPRCRGRVAAPCHHPSRRAPVLAAAEESSLLGAVVCPSPPARQRSPPHSPSPWQPVARLLPLPSGNSAAPQSPGAAGPPVPPLVLAGWEPAALAALRLLPARWRPRGGRGTHLRRDGFSEQGEGCSVLPPVPGQAGQLER